jgi:DNA topoisomerase-1
LFFCHRLTPQHFTIEKIEKRKRQDMPPAPLTTSTLQQRASSQCYFSAKKTMMVAQQLYEGIALGAQGNVGLITYMRTDSVRLSDDAINAIKEYVVGEFGKEYFPETLNKHKSKKSAQEAHEAIRPTDISRHPDGLKKYLSDDQFRLYNLVWKRTVISQMSPSKIHNTTMDIACDDAIFRARGREILFPGYLALEAGDDKEESAILPPLEEGQTLTLTEMKPEQHFTSPPPRYTEASLVKTLEAEGIGRPSTYAPTLTTVQDRGYVKKKERKFYASKLGILVTELLEEHFPQIVNYAFTSSMENSLDSIEEGSTEWVTFLKEFYEPFIATVHEAADKMKDFKKEGEVTDEKCRLCEKPMVIKWSKNGQFMGCSGFPECRSTKPMPGEEDEDEDVNTKNLTPCEKCGQPMMIKHGRVGKFVSCSTYPECKKTRAISTGIKCPQENCEGELVARRSKKGRPFYGCSRYPDCDFITNRITDYKKATETVGEENPT